MYISNSVLETEKECKKTTIIKIDALTYFMCITFSIVTRHLAIDSNQTRPVLSLNGLALWH